HNMLGHRGERSITAAAKEGGSGKWAGGGLMRRLFSTGPTPDEKAAIHWNARDIGAMVADRERPVCYASGQGPNRVFIHMILSNQAWWPGARRVGWSRVPFSAIAGLAIAYSKLAERTATRIEFAAEDVPVTTFVGRVESRSTLLLRALPIGQQLCPETEWW